jgi:RNA polymerase sigma-70 factor (ECF subfamily)
MKLTAQSLFLDRWKLMPQKSLAPPEAQEQSHLIARAQEGDEAAISQLYRRHAPGIYGYLASRVGDAALADDLTSEVFLRALEALPQFEDRGIPFRAWLYRIAHDRMVDHFRRQARRPTTPLQEARLPAMAGIDQVVETRLKMAQLGEAMERLTLEQHQVILLRFLAGFKLAEIAYVMDKSTAAVKMLQLRALTRLRQEIAQTD